MIDFTESINRSLRRTLKVLCLNDADLSNNLESKYINQNSDCVLNSFLNIINIQDEKISQYLTTTLKKLGSLSDLTIICHNK
jgi:hypothetical protein